MFSLSKEHNVNYLAKIVQLKGIKKHPNADKLQVVVIDFQEVIIGLDQQDGDICVFFPLESQINAEFLAFTNSYRHSNLNRVENDEKCGFFEDNGRVRAVRLRGQKSMGYLVPAKHITEWLDDPGIDWLSLVGTEFDTIGKKLMLKKYFVPTRNSGLTNRQLGRKPRISRLVEGQVHLHVDTENLRRNMDRIDPESLISITYKVHGTSFWVSNVLVKKKLKLYEKILSFIGVRIRDTEYDYVYGSRKVVKNEYETQGKNHFYEYDLWGEIKDELKDSIPKGYTVYGECLGYTKGGGYIQKPYDYGCEQGAKKLMIYRITFTNEDGYVWNLQTPEIKEFCERYNLEYVPLFYYGKAADLLSSVILDSSKDLIDLLKGEATDQWREGFMKELENKYTEKDCFLCKNIVPEEGIVIRKESPFVFETYKLKSFKFLEHETKLLDEGVEDMESTN